MDASRRGDDRWQEGVTQALGRVALPIFVNLRPSPLIEREIKVLMAQGAIQRRVVGAAMEVVHCGDVYCDSPKSSNAHGAGKHVCHIVPILRALNPGDILGVGVESSLAEEGHETLQDVVGLVWRTEIRVISVRFGETDMTKPNRYHDDILSPD